MRWKLSLVIKQVLSNISAKLSFNIQGVRKKVGSIYGFTNCRLVKGSPFT